MAGCRSGIFAIGNDGCLHYIQQNGANAAFGEKWVSLGAENITAFDIGQNIDGMLVAVINSEQQIWRPPRTNTRYYQTNEA
jgi:hypothetical protein